MAGSSQRALKAWADKKFKERRFKRGCNKTQRRLKGDAKKIQRRFIGDTQEAQRRFKGEPKEAHTRIKGGSREIQKRLKRKVKEAQRKLHGSSKEAQERLKGDRKKGERKFKRGSKEAQKGPQKLQRNQWGANGPDFEQEGGRRKTIDERSAAELGKCQVGKLNFQRWFPKFSRATANLLRCQQWQKMKSLLCKYIRQHIWFSTCMTELQHQRQIVPWVSVRHSVWKTPKQGQSQIPKPVARDGASSVGLKLDEIGPDDVFCYIRLFQGHPRRDGFRGVSEGSEILIFFFWRLRNGRMIRFEAYGISKVWNRSRQPVLLYFFFLRLPTGQYGPVSQLSRSEEHCTGPFNWGEAHCAGEKVKRKKGPFQWKSLWIKPNRKTTKGRGPPRQPGTPRPGSQVHGPKRKTTTTNKRLHKQILVRLNVLDLQWTVLAVAKRYRPWPKGLRTDSLPWFDSPLVQGASRLRYTDKAQVAATGPYWPKGARNKKKNCSGRFSNPLRYSDPYSRRVRRSIRPLQGHPEPSSEGLRGVSEGSETEGLEMAVWCVLNYTAVQNWMKSVLDIRLVQGHPEASFQRDLKPCGFRGVLEGSETVWFQRGFRGVWNRVVSEGFQRGLKTVWFQRGFRGVWNRVVSERFQRGLKPCGLRGVSEGSETVWFQSLYNLFWIIWRLQIGWNQVPTSRCCSEAVSSMA